MRRQENEKFTFFNFFFAMLVDICRSAENLVGKKREKNGRIVFVTLNLSTSSMRAVLPEVTQVWKKEGATLDGRIIIIVIVSAKGAKTPSIMV